MMATKMTTTRSSSRVKPPLEARERAYLERKVVCKRTETLRTKGTGSASRVPRYPTIQTWSRPRFFRGEQDSLPSSGRRRLYRLRGYEKRFGPRRESRTRSPLYIRLGSARRCVV